MRSGSIAATSAIANAALVVYCLTGLLACHRKIEEPDPSPRPSLSTSVGASASYAPLSAKERHDKQIKLPAPACEEAAKHYNSIQGKKDTDRSGIDLLSSCLAYGNVAWHHCALAATTKADFDTCSRRLMIPE